MNSPITINKDLHPCFNHHASKKHMRIHLPVAPKCNIQCNYCNRKYSCMNENRPGVSCNILSPHQSLYYVENLYKKNKDISVVGIAGPGDAMANPEETFGTLRLIREKGIPMLFCMATNGLKVDQYLDDIAELQVSHITVTINAIDPEIGKLIYAWVRDDTHIYRGIEGASLLLERQLSAVEKLSKLGLTVKVNSILIPGVNDEHIPEIARKVKELGADIFNIMPLYPVEDTAFEYIEAPTKTRVAEVQGMCEEIIPLMKHCQRCRSDAAGLLHEGVRPEFRAELDKVAKMSLNPFENKNHIAVATTDGVHVNVHLGQAKEVLIYQRAGHVFKVLESRKLPEEGGGDARWTEMAKILEDCKAIVVSHVGRRPQEMLKKAGIKVYESNESIKNIISGIYEGGDKINDLFSPQGCAGPEADNFETSGCGESLPCSERGCNGCGGSS